MKSGGMSVAGLIALVVACAGVSAHAQPVDAVPPAPARREVVFSPDTPDRCEWFFITETNVSYVPANAPDSKFLFDDSFGIMKQVGEHTAVGASVDFILTSESANYAPTLRYKRWHGTQSLDLMLGYVPGEEQEGPTGPILTARYSPARRFHMQIGACQFREVPNDYHYDYTYRVYSNGPQKPLRAFAGIGFGGVPGVVLLGGQAVILMIAMAAWASSGGL